MHSNTPTPTPTPTPASSPEKSSLASVRSTPEHIVDALSAMFPGHTHIKKDNEGLGNYMHVPWREDSGKIKAELHQLIQDPSDSNGRSFIPEVMVEDLLQTLTERNVFITDEIPSVDQALEIVDKGNYTSIAIVLDASVFEPENLQLMKQANLAAELFTDIFEEKKLVGKWKPHKSGEFVVGYLQTFYNEESAQAFTGADNIPGITKREAFHLQDRVDQIESELREINAIADDASLEFYVEPERGFGVDIGDARIGVKIQTGDLDSVGSILRATENLRTTRPNYQLWKTLTPAVELVLESLLAEKGLSLYLTKSGGRLSSKDLSLVNLAPRSIAEPDVYSLSIKPQSLEARNLLIEIFAELSIECFSKDPQEQTGRQKYQLTVSNVQDEAFHSFFSSHLPFEKI